MCSVCAVEATQAARAAQGPNLSTGEEVEESTVMTRYSFHLEEDASTSLHTRPDESTFGRTSMRNLVASFVLSAKTPFPALGATAVEAF